MDNIFDEFTSAELRDIFRKPTEEWPEGFCEYVNNILSGQLLDAWLESHDDKDYREEVRRIVEDLTYGYKDDEGNELLEFNENVENDGQMRLFP